MKAIISMDKVMIKMILKLVITFALLDKWADVSGGEIRGHRARSRVELGPPLLLPCTHRDDMCDETTAMTRARGWSVLGLLMLGTT